jgi:hypothetical protein
MYARDNTVGGAGSDDIGAGFAKPMRSMTPDAPFGHSMGVHASSSVLNSAGEVSVNRPQSHSQTFRSSSASISKSWDSTSAAHGGGPAQYGQQPGE